MPKRKLEVVGFDHGNGFLKAKGDQREICLPSRFALWSEFEGESFAQEELQLHQYQSKTIDKRIYAWGEDIIHAEHPIKTYSGEERYLEAPYKLLSEFGLAELFPGLEDPVHIRLVVGCPSQEWHTVQEEKIQEVYNGTHVVQVDDKDRVIIVDELRILAQPLGTLFYMYLDDDGYVANDAEHFEKDTIGVIDIGSGTTDLNKIDGLKIDNDYAGTIEAGMFTAYQAIADKINQKYGYQVATKESVEYQLRLSDHKSEIYHISKRMGDINIKEFKEEAFEQLANYIHMELRQRWPKMSVFDQLIVTGGGAEVLKQYLEKRLGHGVTFLDNNRANAIGFYRYGKSMDLIGEEES